MVGHEAAKFTPATEAQAREVIRRCITHYAHQQGAMPTVVSGRCPLGGVDIYAEEEAARLGAPTLIFPPATNRWADGFQPRNLQIAAHCEVALCIVVRELPPSYRGRRFDICYHCKGERPPHVKSGGCWTVIRAVRLGANGYWKII